MPLVPTVSRSLGMSKRIPDNATREAKRARYNKAFEELLASLEDVSSEESVTSERREHVKLELAPGESVGEAEEHGGTNTLPLPDQAEHQLLPMADQAAIQLLPMADQVEQVQRQHGGGEHVMQDAPIPLLPVKIEPPSLGRLSLTNTLPLDLHLQCTGQAECVCAYCLWSRDWFNYYPKYFDHGGPSGPPAF